MDKIHDEVFGEMEYDYGWTKREQISLWGKDLNINITAWAYTGDSITTEQRKSYQKFLDSLDSISDSTLKAVIEYVSENYDMNDSEEILETLSPETILFKQDGRCGILCDFTLDEENGIVVCVFPTIEVGSQDIFL